MSQVSRLNGFKPVANLLTGSFTAQSQLCFVPSTDSSVIMVGDLVKLAGDSRSPTGVPTVTRVSAVTDPIFGVVVGIPFTGDGDVQNVPPVNDLNTPVYRRANTDRYLQVIIDPNVIFEVQVSAAGSFTTADVGLNASPRITAGNTSSGASGMDLDIATKATTATLTLKIIGFPYRPDNAVGDPFVSVYVKINNHQLNSGTGTAGV